MASVGASLDIRKLLMYPIPHRQLFGVEVLLRTTSGIEMLLLVTGASLGTLFNPRRPWWAALGVLPFIAFNLLVSAGAREVLWRLFSRRRIREIAGLLFVIAIALPQVLLREGGSHPRLQRLFASAGGPEWPWSATAEILLGRISLIAVLTLTAYIVAAYAFARWQFERNLSFDADAASATVARPRDRQSSRFGGLLTWPSALFGDPVAALVEKELRTLARSPRFRLVFTMGFTFGLLIWLPMAFGGGKRGFFAENYLALVSVYALLLIGDVCFWNTFGFDRSAAQLYFAVPVSFRVTLLAKNMASLFFVIAEVTAIMLVSALVRAPVDARQVADAYGVVIAVSPYLLGIGNLTSVRSPRGVDPSKSMRSGRAGPMQALLLFVYPIAGAPVALAYLARYAFDSNVAFYIVLAVAAMVGGIVYWVATDSSMQTAQRESERIITALVERRGSGERVITCGRCAARRRRTSSAGTRRARIPLRASARRVGRHSETCGSIRADTSRLASSPR